MFNDCRKLYISYVVLWTILVAFIGGSIGYNLRHTPVYIYVQYKDAKVNLSKSMEESGITHTKEQFENLMKIIKENRHK